LLGYVRLHLREKWLYLWLLGQDDHLHADERDGVWPEQLVV